MPRTQKSCYRQACCGLSLACVVLTLPMWVIYFLSRRLLSTCTHVRRETVQWSTIKAESQTGDLLLFVNKACFAHGLRFFTGEFDHVAMVIKASPEFFVILAKATALLYGEPFTNKNGTLVRNTSWADWPEGVFTDRYSTNLESSRGKIASRRPTLSDDATRSYLYSIYVLSS